MGSTSRRTGIPIQQVGSDAELWVVGGEIAVHTPRVPDGPEVSPEGAAALEGAAQGISDALRNAGLLP